MFDEARKTSAKLVMMNNTAECMLMLPEDYVAITNGLEGTRLLEMTMRRMAAAVSATYISGDGLWAQIVVTDEDITGISNAKFE